jgi:hypothetical protein
MRQIVQIQIFKSPCLFKDLDMDMDWLRFEISQRHVYIDFVDDASLSTRVEPPTHKGSSFGYDTWHVSFTQCAYDVS